MSNLKLNIPITFEASAVLSINDGIESKVQSINNEVSAITQNADNIRLSVKNDLNETGIDIDAKKITLNAESTYIYTNGVQAALFENGKIKGDYISANEIDAETLKTTGGVGEVDIRSGVITCSGQNNETQIRFGVTDSGDAILDFIVDNKVIYSLGPDGLIQLNFDNIRNKYSELSFALSNDTSIIKSTLSNNIYLPLTRVDINKTTGKAIGYIESSTYNIDSNGNITILSGVLINNISCVKLSSNSVCCISLEYLESSTTNFYKFIEGYKTITVSGIEQRQYNDSGESSPSSYNLVTYKSQYSNISDRQNSSNYIPNGYYMVLGSTDGYIELDDYEYLYYSGTTPTETGNMCRPIQIMNTACALVDDTSDFCEITIYKYENGIRTNTYTMYGLYGFSTQTPGIIDSAQINWSNVTDRQSLYVVPILPNGLLFTHNINNINTFIETYISQSGQQN